MFIERIEELKEIEGSYSKAAKKLGVERSTLSNIMRGIANPSDETAIELAKIFNDDPALMIAEAHKERAKGQTKEVWKEIEKKLKSVSDCILC